MYSAPASALPTMASASTTIRTVRLLNSGQHPQRGVGGEADDRGVGDGADAGPLPQRDPEQQHEHRHDGDDGAVGQRDPPVDQRGQALVEDVPRVEPEDGADHHAHGDAVQQQSDDQLDEPPRSAVDWYRGEQAHADHSADNWSGHPVPLARNWSCMSETTRISAATLARRLGPGAATTAGSPPTGRWPTGSGPRCWTAGSRSPPACPANANWRPACRCPGRPSAPPTRCCGSRAGSIPGAVRAAGSGCRPGQPGAAGADRRSSSRRRRRSAPAASSAGRTASAGMTIGPDGRPASGGVIDLTTACLPAPAEPLARRGGRRGRRTAPLPGRRRLPAVRPAGAARGDRRAVRGGRGADHRRADPGHLGRPARLHPDRRRTVVGRRPGADRMPDLPGGARRAAGAPPDPGTGRAGRTDPASRRSREAPGMSIFSAPPCGRPRPGSAT